MNNKGFAITGILYGLMLIFILALTSFLSILVGKNKRIDELEKSAYENLELKKETYNFADNDDDYKYTTSSNGLYTFNYNGSICNAYLPSNTVVITSKTKNEETNKLYYKIGGSSNLEDYLELECLK